MGYVAHRGAKDSSRLLGSAGYAGLSAYHSDWARNSGVGERSGVCREHRLLLELLRTFLETDQVDVSSLAGTELLVRRLFQIELAVERNPRAPDFEGLDALLETTARPGGGINVPSLAKWFSDHQQKEAFALKQFRLASEERREIDKKSKANKKEG